MKKIANILQEIELSKVAFIPNPNISSPAGNPELAQAYQQLQQAAQGLPPEAQQQLQQQMQQLQQMPPDQQMQAIQQLIQQVSQASAGAQGGAPQGQGDPSQGGQPGGDPNAQQDPNAQPSSGGGDDPNASNLSSLDKQTITLTLADLLNLVTQGKHSQTTSKIHSSKRDAELNSQILELKHRDKIEDFEQKQKEKEMQKQQEAAMQAQQSSAANLQGGGIYPQQPTGGAGGGTPPPMAGQ
jgi:hypothetical protein